MIHVPFAEFKSWVSEVGPVLVVASGTVSVAQVVECCFDDTAFKICTCRLKANYSFTLTRKHDN